MKKLFSILFVLLLGTFIAHAADTHRIRIKVLPEDALTFYVRYDGDVDNRGSYADRYCSDTLRVFEDVAKPGQEIEIRVDISDSGYKQKQWTENGLPMSHGKSNTYDWSRYVTVSFTMPDEDVELVGIFEYAPDAPTYQPATGSWDPETGTLICDNGTSDDPAGFNYEEDKDKVTTYILGGVTTKSYYFSYQFPNMVTLDLSRTSIKDFYYSDNGDDHSALKEVILPSTIEEFTREAMKAVQLQTLVCFAITPPKLYGTGTYNWETEEYEDWQQKVFFDCPDMVVRVPRESVPLYQAAPGWKDFTILPIDGKYADLTVKLMDRFDAAWLAQFNNMTMLLTNLGTGQVRRLLLNGRNEYEFRYLPQNSNYSLSVINYRGNEAVRVDNIFVGEEDVSTTLTGLKVPRTLKMYYTADGKPLANSEYTMTWMNGNREYLTRGNTLEGVFDGQKMLCATTLDASLARTYQQPDTLIVTVEEPYDMTIPLQLLQKKDVTFTVVDSVTHRGIDKAVIQIVQVLPGGQTGASATLTTAANGVATGEVVATSSIVTVTSPIHGSKSRHVNLADSTSARFTFLPANGTCVQLSHTFQPAVAEGEKVSIQNAYEDGRSLEYTFTATLPDGRDSIITHYLTSYPLYTFYTKLPEGTRLHVAAASVRGDIEPVEAEVEVGQEPTVIVNLPIVERGKVDVSYLISESKKPALLVIDNATGQVVRRQAMETGDKAATVSALPQGQYTIVAMSQGMQYASITTLEQLQQYTEEKDYVSGEVTVSDGTVSRLSLHHIPLCTTQLESNLSTRRATFGQSAVTIGFYAGLTVKVQFDGLEERTWLNYDTYDMSKYPTDCKLEFYVPEGFTNIQTYRSQRIYKVIKNRSIGFDEYSNMTLQELEDSDVKLYANGSYIELKTAATQWDETERKLTIDWPYIDQGGTMSFSMTPTVAGEFRPEIYLSYTLGGKQYREMINAETLNVSRSALNVASTVIKPTFVVMGKAMFIDETETQGESSQMQTAASRRSGQILAAAYNPQPPYFEVTVMDGNQPIGQAKINNEGKWKTTCKLVNPTPLSKHHIYAKIVYQNGISYQTEAKTVTYDPNAVVPLDIRMSFFNHHPVHLVDETVVFDIANHEAYPRSYGYSNEEGYNTDFTFEINLSNNDTTKVYGCDLYVKTQGPDAEEFTIPAHYNARKNRWIAYCKFNTRSLPNVVNAFPYYHHDTVGSADEVYGILSDKDWLARDASKDELESRIQQMIDQIDQAVAHGNESEAPDVNELIALLNQYSELLGFEPIDTDTSDAPESVDEASLDKQIKEILAETQGLADLYGSTIYDVPAEFSSAEISHATGLTRELLLATGYEPIKLDNGEEIFTKALEDGSWNYVDLHSDLVIKIPASVIANVRMNRAITQEDIQDMMDTFMQLIDDFKGKLDMISTVCSNASDAIDLIMFNLEGSIHASKEALRHALKVKDLSNITKHASGVTRLEGLHYLYSEVKAGLDQFRFSEAMGCLTSLWSLVSDAIAFYKDINRFIKLRNSLPDPCPDDQASRDQLYDNINTVVYYGLFYQAAVLTSDIVSLGGAIASLTGLIATQGASVIGIVASLVQMGLSMWAKSTYDATMSDNLGQFVMDKHNLQCHRSKKRPNEKEDCEGCCPGCNGGSEGVLDPSGFVYEGVPDNRLEGVTATVFFRKVSKNIWGDDIEQSVVWNAEDYGQINPQITDENGEYGWMVPTGMWQVKYEKEGYQTEYSEWLPVPPPQLDVNQAMIQYSEPQVNSVKATPQAVRIGFDKYMMADSLTTDNIFVTQGGKQVDGAIAVQISDSLGARLVNSLQFVPAKALPAGQTLTLTIRHNVTSYAGVQMSQDFTQDFDIVASVESLTADSALHVLFDKSVPLTVQAQPAAVAAGKKVSVKMLSDVIATADATELTLDEEGKATLNITGEAHGTTAVVLSMQDDSDVKAVTVLNVKDEQGFICPTPEPNYSDGDVLDDNTLIYLSCELPEATIYYTTDGTCPCNSSSAKRYEGPILFMDNMTLKVIATAPGYEDSDIAEYNFYVSEIVGLPVVQPVQVEGTYTLSGQKVSQNASLRKGIYIRNSRKVVVR